MVISLIACGEKHLFPASGGFDTHSASVTQRPTFFQPFYHMFLLYLFICSLIYRLMTTFSIIKLAKYLMDLQQISQFKGPYCLLK